MTATVELLLGTAGHIDHGKTTLVKALTGIDCDRLPEEKARGITIDIGFASLDLPGLHLGIVDVPGHERFIRNMLAGATGIDLALLVVAADDGIMPQTREHLEILQLLGIRHGVIALTKADTVTADVLELRVLEVRELVSGTFLADAPICPVSALRGWGLEELREALRLAGRGVEAQTEEEWFRLNIDRAFVVQGHGTVVTGSVAAGTVAVGEELDWLPRGERVRVRNLHHHDRPTTMCRRGERAAINLAGVPQEAIRRGDVLARPGFLKSSDRLTIHLTTSRSAPRAIKHRLPVRVHLGTAEVLGVVNLLDAELLKPGQSGLGFLHLDEPVCAVWGQGLILRDSSAEHTLGGGRVLEPAPSVRPKRRQIERLEHLERLLSGTVDERIALVGLLREEEGITLVDAVRDAGATPVQAEASLRELLTRGELVELSVGSRIRILHKDRIAAVSARVLDVLTKCHDSNPLMTSHDRGKVEAEAGYGRHSEIVTAVVERMLAMKTIVGDLRRIAKADFVPKLSANQRKLREKLLTAHLLAGFQPPEIKEFLGEPGANPTVLRDLCEVCCAEGFLVCLTENIYLHTDHLSELRRRLRETLKRTTGLTVADIRDLLATTRKYAVPLCEYLDKAGLTRRDGDLRFAGPNL